MGASAETALSFSNWAHLVNLLRVFLNHSAKDGIRRADRCEDDSDFRFCLGVFTRHPRILSDTEEDGILPQCYPVAF